jgi:hypothetical protein
LIDDVEEIKFGFVQKHRSLSTGEGAVGEAEQNY